MKKQHPHAASDKHTADAAAMSWDASLVPLEEGWLDKMDTTLATTADAFFHDLAWSDSADSLLASPPLGAVKAHTRASLNEAFQTPTKDGAFALGARADESLHLYNISCDALFASCDLTTESPQATTDAESPSRAWGGWGWDDQRIFFQAMKAKWTARDGLQKRWDQLSKKLPTKSVDQIEAFFTAIVAHVRSLLMYGQVAMDANQPDEVRLALICWYRLFASTPVSGADLENPSQKRAIVHRLTTSFLKSRKQMIAAKSAKKKTAKELASPVTTSTTPLTPLTMTHTPVHHPLVRKKRSLPLPEVEVEAPEKSEKRVRHVRSRESSPASSPTPVRAASVASPAYVYDLTTPSKKRQIKVRLVPIDKRTQAAVSQTGAMPKVELKMSSSKRISDVCDHMMKKWAAVVPLLPPHSTLRVVPLGDRLHPGWGTHDISVTCLDIFNHCRQIATDGLVDTVTLEYRWEMEVNDENASPSFMTPNKTTEYTTPQRVKLPRPTNLTVEKPIPVPLDLDFLPSPHELPARDPHDPQVTLNFSTDFNGFLDEGPGACSALMDSLGVPPSVATPRKPTKRITPTLVKPLLRLEMPPPSVV